MKSGTVNCFSILIITLLFFSCANDDDYFVPKPKGYYRIKLPEKKYQRFDNGTCPFSFDVPTYAIVVPDPLHKDEYCWLDIEYPKLGGILYLSYKKVDNNLGQYIEDSRTLAVKHSVKASGIEEQMIEKDSSHVYGILYNIEGNTASSLQFHLTDSANHFLRASLYFNCRPNKDSLEPVLNFITKDVTRMIESFRWK